MTQIGSLAIMRAINAYNPSEGNLFWTYAEAAVKNAITDYIRTAQKEKDRFGEILSMKNIRKKIIITVQILPATFLSATVVPIS